MFTKLYLEFREMQKLTRCNSTDQCCIPVIATMWQHGHFFGLFSLFTLRLFRVIFMLENHMLRHLIDIHIYLQKKCCLEEIFSYGILFVTLMFYL